MIRPLAPASACRRVLIVDDEPQLRSMLMEAIADMHYEPTAVASAEGAIRAMQKETFDILILDLNLPGVSGMDLLKTIRASKPSPQVIIQTGFGSLDDAKQALRMDVVDFLTKPCGLSELETALDRARNRRLAELGDATAPRVIADAEGAPRAPRPAPAPSANSSETAHVGDPVSLDDLERDHILAMLARNGGNRAATAQQLGISVRKLYYRLDQYQRSGHMRSNG
jgi:DNA-binding NtrC family response regulator